MSSKLKSVVYFYRILICFLLSRTVGNGEYQRNIFRKTPTQKTKHLLQDAFLLNEILEPFRYAVTVFVNPINITFSYPLMTTGRLSKAYGFLNNF